MLRPRTLIQTGSVTRSGSHRREKLKSERRFSAFPPLNDFKVLNQANEEIVPPTKMGEYGGIVSFIFAESEDIRVEISGR